MAEVVLSLALPELLPLELLLLELELLLLVATVSAAFAELILGESRGDILLPHVLCLSLFKCSLLAQTNHQQPHNHKEISA